MAFMPPSKRPSKDAFTVTEVGALIESLRHEIRLVAEGLVDLRTKVDNLSKDVGNLRKDADLILVEIRAIRSEMKTFDARLKVVEEKLGIP